MELDHLGGEDLGAFDRLGIRTAFDMRTESERAAQPDVIPAPSSWSVDMLKDMLATARPSRCSSGATGEIVSLPSALERLPPVLHEHRR